jgi:hypothetical protein
MFIKLWKSHFLWSGMKLYNLNDSRNHFAMGETDNLFHCTETKRSKWYETLPDILTYISKQAIKFVYNSMIVLNYIATISRHYWYHPRS